MSEDNNQSANSPQAPTHVGGQPVGQASSANPAAETTRIPQDAAPVAASGENSSTGGASGANEPAGGSGPAGNGQSASGQSAHAQPTNGQSGAPAPTIPPASQGQGGHPAAPKNGKNGGEAGVGNGGAAAKKRQVGLRRIRMTISKVDILSAVKLGFLLSVVFAFMVVVAMAVIWFVLDGIHVFSQLQGLLETLNSAELLEFMQYLEFGRWMSFAVIIAILDVVLLTALTAIGALVYNLISSLVGGVRIAVTDE
ncbi:MAG: DUF3566 domain-containing protein [Ancrocorticia sp.]|uniref:DUF3566 domain-containing protein n=1 Tax=Ancrocorticia sp. TaxID=2593684 RepID=UPI003F8EB9A2